MGDLAAVQAETEAGDSPVEVPLGDTTVQVLAATNWPSSAVRALREGDFDTWASKCLATREDYRVWSAMDPTLGECEEFFNAWGEAAGQSKGESSASPRSSRSTAGR